jgi:transcriptional antiterminator
MEDRVTRLEDDMRDVKSVLSRLEPMIIRIDATLTSTLPHLVIKADLAELRIETRTEISTLSTDLRAEMFDLSTGLRAEMATASAAIRTEMSDLSTGLRAEMAGLRVDVHDRL